MNKKTKLELAVMEWMGLRSGVTLDSRNIEWDDFFETELVIRKMTDKEITTMCARAMGHEGPFAAETRGEGKWIKYDPLHNDEQAMALVKKFGLNITSVIASGMEEAPSWVCKYQNDCVSTNLNNLNQAICECVVKMQMRQN